MAQWSGANPLAPLTSFLDASPDAVQLCSPEGRSLYVNAAYLRLFGAEPPVGADVLQDSVLTASGLGPEIHRAFAGATVELPPFWHDLSAAVAGGTPPTAALAHDDRAPAYLLPRVFPLRDSSGGVALVVFQFEDLTALQTALEAKQEFMSVAAHELRTPLTALLGHAQILMRSLSTPAPSFDRLRHGAASVLQAGVRLQRLISQLLDISRLDQGRLQLRPVEADLVPLVHQVIDELRFRAPELTFEVQGSASLVGIWDAGRLEQVLFNLLDNAVRYGPHNGTVRVTLALLSEGGQALISIEDEGSGLPEEDLERLFDRYYRAPTRRGGASPGLGFGLFLAHEIVALHGGRMQATSERGRGLHVSFTLPLQQRGG